ncbi:MAG TPA: restriction endonuclease subunit S [Verrucomicrobia bacterium]|nr:restriction endonuclease subunit S [Verrucomicrobiota bacterium]
MKNSHEGTKTRRNTKHVGSPLRAFVSSCETQNLTPKLRFPEFRDGPGWEDRPLNDFLSESRLPGSKGNVAKKITVKLWGNGVFGKNEAVQGSVNTQYFRRKAGQFIYSKLDFLNQAFGIIPPSLDNFESTVDLPCFDIAEGLSAQFLLEYVKRKDFYERLGETADGSRKARRIHAETFLSFTIALPPPAEQHKIASCLSSLDDLIGAESQKLDALKTHKKGLMQQLFPRDGETRPRLRFPEFQNGPEWRSDSLGNLFETTSGGTPSRSVQPYWGGNIPWVTTSLVDFCVITEAEEFISEVGLQNSSAKLFPKGTVLVAMYGQGKTRRKVALLGIEAATNQACAAILPRKEIDPHFVFVSLAGRYEELRELSNSGGQENLSQGLIREIPFSYPSDETEQRTIISCLSSLDDLIAAQSDQVEALKTHKKGLMQQLFPATEDN